MLFCHFDDVFHFFANTVIILPAMRDQTGATVLYAFFCIGEVTTAAVAKCIKGAETEQTAEFFGIGADMAGEILTLFILKKIVMAHFYLLCKFTDK